MSKATEMLQDIEKNGLLAKGKTELVKHLYGERLTIRQMAIAKCYDCMGFTATAGGRIAESPNVPCIRSCPTKLVRNTAVKRAHP